MAHKVLVLSKDYNSQTSFVFLFQFGSKLKDLSMYSIVLLAFENHREALPSTIYNQTLLSNVSIITQDDLTKRSYKLVSEAKVRLAKHNKTEKDSK